MAYRLKGCGRCGGDTQLEYDAEFRIYEWVCIQCGSRTGGRSVDRRPRPKVQITRNQPGKYQRVDGKFLHQVYTQGEHSLEDVTVDYQERYGGSISPSTVAKALRYNGYQVRDKGFRRS